MNVNSPTLETLIDRRDRLLQILHSIGRCAVAFSGGIDSTVVARAAVEALGANAVAVTGRSSSVPQSEIDLAILIAKQIGIRHLIIDTQEFENEDYLRNDGARCYHCKSELYSRIESALPALGIETICSGANLDDQGDYRPGLTAAAEHRVRHPLQEAGFTKDDVRRLAHEWSLPTWDKPASPCLSSRIVPGLAVTPERTARVEQAEAWLREQGLRDFRVRYHEGDLARIEVPVEHIARLAELELRTLLVQHFRMLGFRYITLDLEGFRSGNMNALIDLSIRKRFE